MSCGFQPLPYQVALTQRVNLHPSTSCVAAFIDEADALRFIAACPRSKHLHYHLLMSQSYHDYHAKILGKEFRDKWWLRLQPYDVGVKMPVSPGLAPRPRPV